MNPAQPTSRRGARNGDTARPLPPDSVLAMGAELKSTFCIAGRRRAPATSEVFGDLKEPAVFRRYFRAIADALGGESPELIVCDLHPAYLSTRHAEQLAREWSRPLLRVQHHHAHVLALMAERGVESRVVGVVCDGVGYGSDGNAWGGEILLCTPTTSQRCAHLREFPLPGGDLAAIQTWRPAVGLLAAALGSSWHAWLVEHAPACAARLERCGADIRLIMAQLARRDTLMHTSSLGRIFDAVAFLTGVCGENRCEAQAAIALETAAESQPTEVPPLAYVLRAAPRVGDATGSDTATIDLGPMVLEIAQAASRGEPFDRLAGQFHETVARALADAAIGTARRHHVPTAALTGGSFVNRRLRTRVAALLEAAGLRVLTHETVSPGDSGISLGQAWAGLHWMRLARIKACAGEDRAALAAARGG
ncbi:MAG: Carbamoyltransferase HypF [Phycisphaerae bacterium]|nr:Carbamoyltransferase HypF [Phycisphaerae bacterium]